LKTFRGFSKDSTASDKLKGVVVRVRRVEKKIIRIKRLKIMPACDSPSSVILTKANRKIVAPPEVKNNWNKVVKAMIKTMDWIPFKKNFKGTLDSKTKLKTKTNNSRLVTRLLAQKINRIKRNIASNLLRGSKRWMIEFPGI